MRGFHFRDELPKGRAKERKSRLRPRRLLRPMTYRQRLFPEYRRTRMPINHNHLRTSPESAHLYLLPQPRPTISIADQVLNHESPTEETLHQSREAGRRHYNLSHSNRASRLADVQQHSSQDLTHRFRRLLKPRRPSHPVLLRYPCLLRCKAL